ncbi:hypothetical protein PSPO01_15199 [Paraphaeosphaeria sporulosa]
MPMAISHSDLTHIPTPEAGLKSSAFSSPSPLREMIDCPRRDQDSRSIDRPVGDDPAAQRGLLKTRNEFLAHSNPSSVASEKGKMLGLISIGLGYFHKHLTGLKMPRTHMKSLLYDLRHYACHQSHEMPGRKECMGFLVKSKEDSHRLSST